MCSKLTCLITFAMVLFAITPATNAQVINLLQNPSFEEDEAILDDPAWEQWCTWNPAEGAGSTAAVDETDFIDGKRSLRINPKGTSNWHFIVLYLPISVDINKNYTISFWAKAEQPRPLTVALKAENNSIAAWGATNFNLTTEWAEYHYASNVLIDVVKLEIWCSATEVPFWLDFVYMYEGDYVAGIEPSRTVTIPVGPDGDIAAANELAKPGDTIQIAAGTFRLTSQIAIKDGVTYQGAGPGLTIIDGNNVTRAFTAWGDRFFNEDNDQSNNSGPKSWIIEGMTIQNCVADANDRFSYTAAAFDLKTNFATLDANASGGLDPAEADAQVGGIRLAGADGTEGTADDDLHRFAHIDIDSSGEISLAELDAQLLLREDEFGDESGDGGAITIANEAAGTIRNCEFLKNHTLSVGAADDGGAINVTGISVVTIDDCRFVGNYAIDDGGAININSLSVVTLNGCRFDGNYAASPDSVAVPDRDGDGGHIAVQGGSASALTPGTTLIASRCTFLNGDASDDGGAIRTGAVGSIVRLDACWFEGNTTWDNGSVMQIGNEGSGELTVTNCVFANNITKADNGPDRMCEVRRNSKFVNCTFVGNNQNDEDLIYNNADIVDADGDGVEDETADTTHVVNCLFANNVAGNGDDIMGCRNAKFTVAATNCLFFANKLQNGNAADNVQTPEGTETGSVKADPLLDAGYVPRAGSPAIDAGVNPAAVGVTLTTDYNGNPRPQGAAYDIGAYEVGP